MSTDLVALLSNNTTIVVVNRATGATYSIATPAPSMTTAADIYAFDAAIIDVWVCGNNAAGNVVVGRCQVHWSFATLTTTGTALRIWGTSAADMYVAVANGTTLEIWGNGSGSWIMVTSKDPGGAIQAANWAWAPECDDAEIYGGWWEDQDYISGHVWYFDTSLVWTHEIDNNPPTVGIPCEDGWRHDTSNDFILAGATGPAETDGAILWWSLAGGWAVDHTMSVAGGSFHGIWGVDLDNVWAAGDGGIIAAWNDVTSVWDEAVVRAATTTWKAMRGESATEIFVLGVDALSGALYKFDGTSWSDVGNHVVAAHNGWTRLSLFESITGWGGLVASAVGAGGSAEGSGIDFSDATDGPYQLITNGNNYELDYLGQIKRDPTIASRCRARLCTQRGRWVCDLDFGSRLHEIQTMKDARHKVMDCIREALQPLTDAGEIINIRALEYIEDPTTGRLGVHVEVMEPSGGVVPLGIVPVGA